MSDPQTDYIAAHAHAAQGGNSMSAAMDILNGGNGYGVGAPPPEAAPPAATPPPQAPPQAAAAQPPQPGAPPPSGAPPATTGFVPPPLPAPPPPPKPMPPSDLPYGRQLTDLMKSYGQRVTNWVSSAYVPPAKRESFWSALSQGVTGIPAEIGHEFKDNISRIPEDVMPFAHLQGNITDLQRLGPNAANDVLGAVLSPLYGTLKSGIARPLEAATGIQRDVTTNVLGALALHRAFGATERMMQARGIPVPPDAGGPPPPPGAPPAEGAAATAAKPEVPDILYRDHPTTDRLKELDAKMASGEGLTDAERQELHTITAQRANDLGPIEAPEAKLPPTQTPGATQIPGMTAEPTRPESGFTLGPEGRAATDQMTPANRAEFESFARGDETASPVNVALRGLSDPETAVQTIHDLAKILPRQGVMSMDEMEMRARSLGLSIDEVGEAARLRDLAPTQTALQAALLSAGRQVGESARAWRESGGDQRLLAAHESDVMRLLRFMDIWDTSGTEMGRGMRARQEGAQQFSDFDQQLRSLFENHGHLPFEDMANKIADLVRDSPDPAVGGSRTAKFLNWAMRWTGSDAMRTAFYNILLSNPAIIGKKIVSDHSMAATNIATTFWAEKLGRGENRFPAGTTKALIAGYREALPSLGDYKDMVVGAADVARNYARERAGDAAEGSTAEMIRGYYAAMPEMFRLAAGALKVGGGQLWGDYNSLREGVETSRDRLSQLANGLPLDENSTALEQAGSWWRAMMPTSWIGAVDDMAKYAHYRAALHSWAWREAADRIAVREQAAARGAPQGNAPPMSHEELYQSLVDSPTDKGHNWAASQAQDWALQRDLGDGFVGTAAKMIDKAMIPLRMGPYRTEIPIGRIIMPFTKIVTNSMRFAYRYSPASFIFESPAWKDDMRAGGPRKALALASRGLGTTAMMSMLPVLAGALPGVRITGHGPTGFAQRRQWLADGNEPYTVYVGGNAIPYGNIEFLASWLGPMADGRDLMASSNREDDGLGVAQSLILGVGSTITNKSMMEGLSDFMEALEHPDTKGKRYFYNLGASALPFASGGAFAMRRGIDPYMRMHNDFATTVASRTPGFSEGLPPVVTTWGDPVKYQGNFMGRMGWPLAVHEKPYVQPVDEFLADHKLDWTGMDPNHVGFSPPGNTLTVSAFAPGMKLPTDLKEPSIQVPLTLQEEHDYKVLAGQGVKEQANGLSIWNSFGGQAKINAKDGFNALVQHRFPDAEVQKLFDNYSPREQVQMLINAWGIYRKAARDQFMARPDIAGIVKDARAARADQLAGKTKPQGGLLEMLGAGQ